MGKYFWSRASNWFQWFPNETYVGIFRDVRGCVKYEVFIGESYEEALAQAKEFSFKHGKKLVTLISYVEAVKMRDRLSAKKWEEILNSDAN